jgi:parvulin-like peptidyl-prolyl isomerase
MNRFVFVLLILFVFSCNQTKKNAFLASVGNSVLTEKEARLAADVEGGSIKEVVNRWVEEEILFQNAQSSGYYEENNSFAGIEKRLSGQLFLQRIAGEKVKVSNSEIKSYYQKNKSGFIRKNKSARIYHFLFSSKKEAKTAFKILSSNKNEKKKNRLFEERGAQPVIVIDEELLPELNAPLFSSRNKKRLLGPIKSSHGYHIIVVLERFKKNSPIPLEEMYDEIYQRIYQQKFALKSLRILDSLRNHTPYQINL